jgi:hypothetical protein
MHETEVAIVVWVENGAPAEDAALEEALVEDGALVADGVPVKNAALDVCGRVREDFRPRL